MIVAKIFENLVARHANNVVDGDAMLIGDHLVRDNRIKSGAEEFRLNIGKPPRGMSVESYREAVGQGTIAYLGHEGMGGIVYYDPRASQKATEEFDAIDPTQPIPKKERGVRVVFTRFPEQTT
jgi:hypothetical protein